MLWLLVLVLIGCTDNQEQAPLPGTLEATESYSVQLPQGGQISQRDGNRILFLGSMIQRKSNQEATLFDATTKKSLWHQQLPGSAIRAIILPESDYILVTAKDKGNAHLVRLDGQTGKILWDRPFENEALDALWLPEKDGLLVSDGFTLWLIDPDQGKILGTPGTALSKNAHPGSVILAQSIDDAQIIFLASDNMLQQITLTGMKSTSQWQFIAGKFITALLPVHFANSQDGIILLAHSHSYFVSPAGKLLWHIKNQDINYAPIAIPNAQSAQQVVFSNYVKGLYLVNAQGLQQHTPLPGGKVHILGIPMPIPQNILLGGALITPSPYPSLQGYILSVRSLDNFFVYQLSPTGDLSLIAKTAIATEKKGGNIIQKGTLNPNYAPLQIKDALGVTDGDGIHIFVLELQGEQ